MRHLEEIASHIAQGKYSKYKDFIHDHHKFFPFVIETLGRWGHEAIGVLQIGAFIGTGRVLGDA